MQILPQRKGQARRALTAALQRSAAESSLIDFAKLTHVDYRPNWHHVLLASKLEAVARGEIKRLVVSMPPRHGKTELATIRFAPWLLTQRPRASIIAATYSGEFADELGRKARAVLEHPAYSSLWPRSALSADSRAVSRWETVSGGSYFAVGVGGPLTGRGADFLLIDDPHKSRAEAESKVIRDGVLDWFRSTAYTRLEKDGAVVIISTRWHQDDLVGRVLTDGEPWEVLSLPAVAEVADEYRQPGDALWPDKFTAEALGKIRRAVGEREWSALYQQRPAPLEGALFKPDALEVIDAEPAGVEWVRAWDFGATAGGGDPTVGVKLGMWNERPVIADVVRFQGSPDEVERVLLATASVDGRNVTIDLPQDPGQAGKAHVQYLTKRLAGYNVRSSPETGNKVTRAEPLAAQVNVGNAYLVRGSWNRDFIEELRMFPNGSHDDQVDAASRAFAFFVLPKSVAIIEYYRQQCEKLNLLNRS